MTLPIHGPQIPRPLIPAQSLGNEMIDSVGQAVRVARSGHGPGRGPMLVCVATTQVGFGWSYPIREQWAGDGKGNRNADSAVYAVWVCM